MQTIFYYLQRTISCLVLLAGIVSVAQAQSGSVTTAQSFSYTGQIVTWQVPAGVTSLSVTVQGAEGGYGPAQFGGSYTIYAAGKGAQIYGVVSVSGGQTLKILVGQKSPNRNGGGGGSFVTTDANAPLIIAGGGGGSGTDNDLTTKDGQAGQTGGNSGGSNGNGGPGRSGASSGGGGLLTDGGQSDNSAYGLPNYPGGKAFVNGGAGASSGNDSFGTGGFGGGGIGTGTASGGAGGGYSGGAGNGGGPGGGGGSYNADPSGINTAGANSGNGLVTIRYQVPPCTPFSVNLTNNGPLTCVKKSVLLTTTGAPTGASYTYSAGAQASSASSATATVTNSGLYSVTVTVPGGCSATNSTMVSSNTTAPSVTINPASQTICQGQSASFMAQGADSYRWNTMQTTATISVGVAGPYSVTGTSNSNGCSGTATANLTVNPLPAAPSLVTQNGYPYPAGQSNLTISQNVGPVSLTVLGCSGGMLMGNGNAASSFTISTAMTGTQTYTATCTQNGCTGPAGSFQLTVVPTTLSVLHRDADYGNLTNNIIKPYLELANAGGQAIPYGDITVRYWFTSEGNALPTNLAVYYAQLGSVNMKYVPLSQPRQGAYGYVEYSFPGGGSLAGGGSNSGAIENGIQKTDGSNFDESDDYSYQANYQDYSPNMHITAYRNGTIFYGQEPTAVASQMAVQVYSQAKDGTTTSQIQTRLELRNTGNVALPVASLKLRYYFTSDNGQAANVYVDYADMGASNVAASVVRLAPSVNGADSYVELSFPGNPMKVNALSSLGYIDFRLVRSDNGLFDQSNDYSFAANYGNVGLNNRVTAYLSNMLLFGSPPLGAPARAVALEPGSVLQARVLGNPVAGSHALVEVTGAAGQALTLELVDLQGRAIHEQRIEQAGGSEQITLPLGSSRGLLLLKVHTASQQQQLKLIKP